MPKGWAFLGLGPGPSADIDMGFPVLYPPHLFLVAFFYHINYFEYLNENKYVIILVRE